MSIGNKAVIADMFCVRSSVLILMFSNKTFIFYNIFSIV
jgi:hypothetical protein